MPASKNPNRPLYARCDYCGRNPHKVAVRFPRGTSRDIHPTRGYCPSCYAENVARRDGWPQSVGGVIIYDRRRVAKVATSPAPVADDAPKTARFLASHLTPGTRVSWTREVYRMPYSKRPTDTGTVLANDGSGYVTVRNDATGSEVTGVWAAFHVVDDAGAFVAVDPSAIAEAVAENNAAPEVSTAPRPRDGYVSVVQTPGFVIEALTGASVTDDETRDVIEWCRTFAADCDWQDADAADIAAMDTNVLLRACNRHVDGGLAFVLADVREVADEVDAIEAASEDADYAHSLHITGGADMPAASGMTTTGMKVDALRAGAAALRTIANNERARFERMAARPHGTHAADVMDEANIAAIDNARQSDILEAMAAKLESLAPIAGGSQDADAREVADTGGRYVAARVSAGWTVLDTDTHEVIRLVAPSETAAREYAADWNASPQRRPAVAAWESTRDWPRDPVAEIISDRYAVANGRTRAYTREHDSATCPECKAETGAACNRPVGRVCARDAREAAEAWRAKSGEPARPRVPSGVPVWRISFADGSFERFAASSFEVAARYAMSTGRDVYGLAPVADTGATLSPSLAYAALHAVGIEPTGEDGTPSEHAASALASLAKGHTGTGAHELRLALEALEAREPASADTRAAMRSSFEVVGLCRLTGAQALTAARLTDGAETANRVPMRATVTAWREDDDGAVALVLSCDSSPAPNYPTGAIVSGLWRPIASASEAGAVVMSSDGRAVIVRADDDVYLIAPGGSFERSSH